MLKHPKTVRLDFPWTQTNKFVRDKNFLFVRSVNSVLASVIDCIYWVFVVLEVLAAISKLTPDKIDRQKP